MLKKIVFTKQHTLIQFRQIHESSKDSNQYNFKLKFHGISKEMF